MFTGFTDETVDFMWGIRFNNERAWFEAHKEIYLHHFYRPMQALGAEIYTFIRDKRPDYDLPHLPGRPPPPRPGALQGKPVVFCGGARGAVDGQAHLLV